MDLPFLNKLFWASVIGNLLLAASAYFLFTGNSNLKAEGGKKDATIAGYVKTTDAYKQQIAQCVDTQKTLIVTHRNEITSLQEERARYLRENATRVDALLAERGRIEGILKGIKQPVSTGSEAERLKRIDQMLDAYIEELKR